MEEEAKRVREIQRQRERDKEREREREAEQNRIEQEEYNASFPKTRTPLAKQELGGYPGGTEDPASSASPRYNPSRAAPQAPGSQRDRQQLQGAGAAQRAAPSAPNSASRSPGRPINDGLQNGQTSLRSPEAKYREPSPGAKYDGGSDPRKEQSHTRQQPNGVSGSSPPSRLPAPVQQPKPLNIANKQPQPTTPNTTTDPGRKEAEIALSSKKPVEERSKEVRMSSMSESEVMAKLKQVVSKDNPLESYSKQKKIGQGASGSVYVARVKDGASSPIARELYRMHGPKGQVAIKQMDLRNQPRKELIVNEIIVMKDSKHPNIVNFLDSFLQEQNNELWVVMEFMEGGALTDVIDNNPVITEDQISTICFETCKGLAHLHSQDIIHRDIKSDNVLLDRIGNVKISKSSDSRGPPAQLLMLPCSGLWLLRQIDGI